MKSKTYSRSQMRGDKLDADCKYKSVIVRDADGPGDPRQFCSGIMDELTKDIKDKCTACKAYVENAKPWPGERFGILPGQISIDEFLNMEGKHDDRQTDTI